jgi:hypothetical protein
MAGIRQHILPRFLQKGFASRVTKKTGKQDIVYTWVYRKGTAPFETATENVGVEKYFYGKAGELNVDDEITDIETEFVEVIAELRGKGDGFKISEPMVADFIGHLSIRTKHLRDSFVDMAEMFSTILFGYLADFKKLRAWVLEYHKRHPELIKKTVDEELNKMQLTRIQKLRMREYMIMQLRPERIVMGMDKDKSNYEFLFNSLTPTFLEQIPNIAREGHIKALAKNLVPEPRMEVYRQLHWFVCKSNVPLILGDVGVLFEVAGVKQFMSLTGKEDELKAAFLPISSDTMVVGTSFSEVPKVNFGTLNEAIARHSRDFFISGQVSPEIESLQPLLGTRAEIFSEQEIEQILMEGMNEM